MNRLRWPRTRVADPLDEAFDQQGRARREGWPVQPAGRLVADVAAQVTALLGGQE